MNHASMPGAAAPMEGHGCYNRSSRVQAAGLSPALPLLEQAAAQVPVDGAAPIVIADYGSSEGKNSLAPMLAAIHALRKRVGALRPISVVHTDLPGNDFSALFQLLRDDPGSYLRVDPATFASAVGRSFYQQLLPSESVALGWSSWAVQWLSRAPGTIGDHVQVACSRNADARAAFKHRAAEDWKTFLECRGRELRPGGRLVALTMALHDDGDFGYRELLQSMYAALLELRDQGLIRAGEAHRMVIPTVGRSRGDLLAPFDRDGQFAGLSLEHIEVFDGEDRLWRQYERDHDAAKFGATWAAFSRASVFPSLALGLDGGASDPRAAAFAAQLEAGLAARLSAAPTSMAIPLASIVVARR